MEETEKKLEEARQFLQKRISSIPKIAIILGTGLSGLAGNLKIKVRIPYQKIPHFPISTVETHTGNLIFGSLKNHEVVVFQGRFHYYEGYSLEQVVFPIRVISRIGATTLISTNAAGGLNPEFSPSEIMVISDHINFMGANPLRGPNIESLGIRFPSMHEVYSKSLIGNLQKAADAQGILLRKGVYVAIPGPSLETPAETKFLRMIGADAVGMSTVPEAIAAVHAGMQVLGVSVISNINIPESMGPTPIEEVVIHVRQAEITLQSLLEGFLDYLGT